MDCYKLTDKLNGKSTLTWCSTKEQVYIYPDWTPDTCTVTLVKKG